MMIPPALWPPTHSEYDQAESTSGQIEVEDKEQEQMQTELPPDRLLTEVEVENRERELKTGFTPLQRTYLAYLIIFLLIIVALVLLDVFHLI